MIGMMNSLYLYLKAIHIIAAFAWMAGMFYLPRLYVYHAKVGAGRTASRDVQGHGARAC